jgi:hypothetical protein
MCGNGAVGDGANEAIANADALEAAERERDELKEALEFIGNQPCDVSGDGEGRICPDSDWCVTEYCLSCYALAVLSGGRHENDQ